MTRHTATILLVASTSLVAARGTLVAQACDTTRARTQVRVTMDLGDSVPVTFLARTFRLDVDRTVPSPVVSVNVTADASHSARPAHAEPGDTLSSAELHLVKPVDAYTGRLVKLGESGSAARDAILEVLDSTGRATLTLRMSGAVVAGEHLDYADGVTELQPQRIEQADVITQLAADLESAEREAAMTEQLGKTHAATPADLARVRERVTVLRERLALAQQRGCLLQRDMANRAAVEEQVTLRFVRLDVQAP